MSIAEVLTATAKSVAKSVCGTVDRLYSPRMPESRDRVGRVAFEMDFAKIFPILPRFEDPFVLG
jgi:hypothetical protein